MTCACGEELELKLELNADDVVARIDTSLWHYIMWKCNKCQQVYVTDYPDKKVVRK